MKESVRCRLFSSCSVSSLEPCSSLPWPFSRDRRALIIERRAKVLSLAKDMKTAGFTAAQLRDLERRLTKED